MIRRSLSQWLAPALLAAGYLAAPVYSQALPSAQSASPQTQARTLVQVPILSRAVAPPATAIYAAPQQPRTILRRSIAPTSTLVLEAPREAAPRQYRAVPGRPLCGHRLWSRLATLTAARPRLVEVAEEPGPALGLVTQQAEVLTLEQPAPQVVEVPAAPEAPIFAEPEAPRSMPPLSDKNTPSSRGLPGPGKTTPEAGERGVTPGALEEAIKELRKAREALEGKPRGDTVPEPPPVETKTEVQSSWEPERGRE